MAENQNAAKKAPEPGRSPTKGSLFMVLACIVVGILFVYFEFNVIPEMLDEGVDKTLGHLAVFALVILFDFLFLGTLALYSIFSVVSRVFGSHPKGSLLARADDFLEDMLPWIAGGIWFCRLVLQIFVQGMYSSL